MAKIMHPDTVGSDVLIRVLMYIGTIQKTIRSLSEVEGRN